MAAGNKRVRFWIIVAALLALFLGALDALVMSAAMPTIISELGGLHLYAWAYSSYFLARAVSLPVFGKLSDLFAVKKLLLFSIALFVSASLAAGASGSMAFLVGTRVFQGIGAGGIFALVYVVLSGVSEPGERAKTLSFASSIWGIASLIGPTLGGFIVTWFSWRWIFFINLPIGLISFAGIAFFFKEFREMPSQAHLDWPGALLLSGSILGLLLIVMTGGRVLPWFSLELVFMVGVTLCLGVGFCRVEQQAADPILDISFFKYPAFALGNLVAFCASFAIFSLFAYAPLYLQGALGRSPLQVGYAMLSLSLGWSVGSLFIGRVMHRIGPKGAAIWGSLLMAAGGALTLVFSETTSMLYCFLVFQVSGLGMGCITLSTLLIVQDSLGPENLGVATSFNQFARTLGGTIGVGVCGGLVTARLIDRLENAGTQLPPVLLEKLQKSMSSMFQEEFRMLLPQGVEKLLQTAVFDGVFLAFMVVFAVALVSLILSAFIPVKKQ